jgi:hypothetical protein
MAVKNNFNFDKIWNKIRYIEYILVLDICASAPTEFTIKTEFEERKFFFVEESCALGFEDLGAVLYRFYILIFYLYFFLFNSAYLLLIILFNCC